VAQQFQDDDFATLSGGRVVRIATHPDYSSMGYGSRALEQLEEYFSGKIQSLAEEDSIIQEMPRVTDEEMEDSNILTENIKVRDASSMPPMLLKLSQRPLKEQLQWLGVSYGLTAPLHKFWKRSGYKPVYLRQTANDLTGEHTCIMLKTLQAPGSEVVVGNGSWLSDFSKDFRRRFLELLAYQFRTFSPLLVLSIIDASSDSNQVSSKVINSENDRVSCNFLFISYISQYR
jgi:N-acetyltransferase 10